MDAHDEMPKTSEMLPSIEQLRESQRKGTMGMGLDENYTGKLNEAQAHEVEIKE